MGSVRLAMWRECDDAPVIVVRDDSRANHDCDDREEHQELMVDPAVWEWLSTPMIDEQLVFDDWLDDWSIPLPYGSALFPDVWDEGDDDWSEGGDD